MENLFSTGNKISETTNNINENPIEDIEIITRDEYIERAREACLSQLNNYESFNKFEKHYSYLEDNDKVDDNEIINLEKKTTSSYLNSFIIRLVLSVVIFLSLIVIDKVNFKTNKERNIIKEYVLELDYIDKLEEVFLNLSKAGLGK